MKHALNQFCSSHAFLLKQHFFPDVLTIFKGIYMYTATPLYKTLFVVREVFLKKQKKRKIKKKNLKNQKKDLFIFFKDKNHWLCF